MSLVISAMTVIAQDDHLTAGAWPPVIGCLILTNYVRIFNLHLQVICVVL